MKISCYKREKTTKYSEKQAEKAKNLCKKLANLLYRCFLVWTMKNGNENNYTYEKSKCPDI